MYILQSIICSESLLLLQRNTVHAWDMKGPRPVFSSKRELQGLELPKGTVIEVELVEELQGEVSHPLDTGQYKYHKICLFNPYCLTNIEKDKWYTVYTFFFNFKWMNPLQDFRLLVTASLMPCLLSGPRPKKTRHSLYCGCDCHLWEALCR